jgi:hypothetical protein
MMCYAMLCAVGVVSVLIGAFLLSWDGLAVNPNYGDWIAIIATVVTVAATVYHVHTYIYTMYNIYIYII